MIKRDLPYSTGNYTQYFVITYKGKILKILYLLILYIYESLSLAPETNTAL